MDSFQLPNLSGLIDVTSEVSTIFKYQLFQEILVNLNEGIAVFKEVETLNRFSQFNLIYSNKSFDLMFDVDKDLPHCFSYKIFKEYGSAMTKSKSLFQIVQKYMSQGGVGQQIYAVKPDFKQTSSNNLLQLEGSNIQIREVVSIEIFKITISEIDYIFICVSDLTKSQQLGLDQIQKSYQGTLINALSHERLTPLNTIVNGCEEILKYFRSKDEKSAKLKILNNLDMMWATSKAQHSLTSSQLQNYLIDCNRYQVQPFQLSKTFKEYLEEFLKPAIIKCKVRNIKIEIQDDLLINDLCTDFKIYESILFHLMQNAIKYSPSNSVINLKIFFKSIDQVVGNLSQYLVTEITDQGEGLDPNRQFNQQFQTFSQAGINQNKNETSSVGIGLSTAYALTKYLGGDFQVLSNRQQSFGTKVTYYVATTLIRQTFKQDLEELRQINLTEQSKFEVINKEISFLTRCLMKNTALVTEELKVEGFSCTDMRKKKVIDSVALSIPQIVVNQSVGSFISLSFNSEPKSRVSDINKYSANFQMPNFSQMKGNCVFQDERLLNSDFVQMKQSFKIEILSQKNNRSERSEEGKGKKSSTYNMKIQNVLKKIVVQNKKKSTNNFELSSLMGDKTNCTDKCTKSVLIVDDCNFNLTILYDMLLVYGIDSEKCESGAQAVKCFQQRLMQRCCSRTFKLVLTDIQMPIIDGFEVSRQVMAMQYSWFESMKKQFSILRFKTKRICPVVAVTALVDLNVQERAKKAEIQDILNKPVSNEALEKVIRKYYDDQQD